jgi:hypothetical protein
MSRSARPHSRFYPAIAAAFPNPMSPEYNGGSVLSATHCGGALASRMCSSASICASLRFYFNNRTASSFERDRQNELEKRPALVRRHGNFTAVLLNNDTANS